MHGMPDEFAPRRLVRRLALIAALLAALVLAALLAPGLGEVQQRLGRADAGWLALAVLLEGLSCASYVLMFRPVFCARMSQRTSAEIALAELAVGSLVPASGASGVALGAWILHREGMPDETIARRSVAFLEIKSAVNFVAVAVIGTLMAIGVLGPQRSPLLTALPAGLAVAFLAAVAALSLLGTGEDPGESASRTRRAMHAARETIGAGTGEALRLLRHPDPRLLAGAIGYWAFDNAVLWATFEAVGADVPLTVIAMGYLIGQLGGILPLPGGVGGIDGGLVGALVVYGAPAADAAAAVLAYRIFLFWLPLLVGVRRSGCCCARSGARSAPSSAVEQVLRLLQRLTDDLGCRGIALGQRCAGRAAASRGARRGGRRDRADGRARPSTSSPSPARRRRPRSSSRPAGPW